MRKLAIILMLFSFFCTQLYAAEIEWIKDYNEALTKAKETNKPIMIDYYTGWCGWCKKLDKSTYRDSSVVAKSAEFINAKIDAEKDRKSATLHGVSAYPTILFLDSSGKEVSRVSGYKNGPEFVMEMLRAQIQAMPEDILKEQAEAGDAEAAYFLGQKYLGVNDFLTSIDYFEKVVQDDKSNESGYKGDALIDMGLAYLQLKNNDGALDSYTLFLDEFKDHGRRYEALYFTGYLYMILNDSESAGLLFNELLERFPKSSYAQNTKRLLQQMEKDTKN